MKYDTIINELLSYSDLAYKSRRKRAYYKKYKNKNIQSGGKKKECERYIQNSINWKWYDSCYKHEAVKCQKNNKSACECPKGKNWYEKKKKCSYPRVKKLKCSKTLLQNLIKEKSDHIFSNIVDRYDEDTAENKSFWFKNKKKYKSEDFLVMKKPLGRGGFGEVKLVKNKKTNELFILKTFFRNSMKESNKERLIAQKLRERCPKKALHTKLCYSEDPRENLDNKKWLNKHSYLMSYPLGVDIWNFLDKNPIQNDIKYAIICQIFQILLCLNKAGFVHCDLKPYNMILTQNGEIIIIDYGTVLVEDKNEKTTVGTPWFRPPGYCKTHKSDIFSLGKIVEFILKHKYNSKIFSWKNYDDKELRSKAKKFVKKLTKHFVIQRPDIYEIFASKEPWNDWFNEIWRK